ncbi:MAG TPA: TetR/AcrR family transcriptional regulator [Xanthobacteraceae bacterium]|nr:TetR/AcrR family transcriptional regulator [Xanthobacteraceae bacterium]
MARPREFDEKAAIEAAIQCFWRRGYEATSVRDLAASMGICGTSLYNAFGDKRALFEQALERYLDETLRARIDRLERLKSPKEAMRRFVDEAIARSLADPHRRGCLLINSALEVAPHDRQLGERIAERLGEIEGFFRRCLVKAAAAGEIPRDRHPDDLARLLLAVVLGIRVLARAKPDRDLLEGLARPALALLDTSSKPETGK